MNTKHELHPFNITYFCKMKFFLFLFSFLSISTMAQKQLSGNATQIVNEHYLKTLTDQLFRAKTDDEKKKYNNELLIAFTDFLNQPDSFDASLDSLKKDMAILVSPDNKFRIINWNLQKADNTFEYFGFIQEKHQEVIKKGSSKKIRRKPCYCFL